MEEQGEQVEDRQEQEDKARLITQVTIRDFTNIKIIRNDITSIVTINDGQLDRSTTRRREFALCRVARQSWSWNSDIITAIQLYRRCWSCRAPWRSSAAGWTG